MKRIVSNYNLCPLKQNISFCLPETTKRQLKWTSFYSLIRCSLELKLISVKSKIAFGSGEMKTNVWDLFHFISSHIELFFRCTHSYSLLLKFQLNFHHKKKNPWEITHSNFVAKKFIYWHNTNTDNWEVFWCTCAISNKHSRPYIEASLEKPVNKSRDITHNITKRRILGKLRIPTLLLKSLSTGIIQILTIERCFDAHVPFQTNIHVHTLKPASKNQLTKAET